MSISQMAEIRWNLLKRKCWPKNLFEFASVTSGLQRLLGVYVEDADIVKKPETETTFKEKFCFTTETKTLERAQILL